MTEKASSAASGPRRFHCIVVVARDLEEAERVLAEAMEAGATGAEQRADEDSESGVTLWLYAAAAEASAVRDAAVVLLGDARVTVREVAPRDWSEAWKAGLSPVEISPRLRVRPSFEVSPPRPGQRDVLVDPGQAFGTGGHESTRLALTWLDALRDELSGPSGVLDVGTGSGVLALAALALGAERAVGFDMDPLATPAARANAAANGATRHLGLFTGTLAALSPGRRFRGVVANLLRRELEPLVPGLAAHVEARGWVVVSGLLDAEVAGWTRCCEPFGLRLEDVRRARDASGAEWVGLLMRPRASARG